MNISELAFNTFKRDRDKARSLSNVQYFKLCLSLSASQLRTGYVDFLLLMPRYVQPQQKRPACFTRASGKKFLNFSSATHPPPLLLLLCSHISSLNFESCSPSLQMKFKCLPMLKKLRGADAHWYWSDFHCRSRATLANVWQLANLLKEKNLHCNKSSPPGWIKSNTPTSYKLTHSSVINDEVRNVLCR